MNLNDLEVTKLFMMKSKALSHIIKYKDIVVVDEKSFLDMLDEKRKNKRVSK